MPIRLLQTAFGLIFEKFIERSENGSGSAGVNANVKIDFVKKVVTFRTIFNITVKGIYIKKAKSTVLKRIDIVINLVLPFKVKHFLPVRFINFLVFFNKI